MKKLLCLIIFIFLFSGCSVPQKIDAATESSRTDTTDPDAIHTVYFPDDKSIAYSHDITADDLVHLQEIIKTNTTQITVKNTGDIPFTCNLYYLENNQDSIQTFKLEPGKKTDFSGLTSRFNYCISFQSEESGTIEANISG